MLLRRTLESVLMLAPLALAAPLAAQAPPAPAPPPGAIDAATQAGLHHLLATQEVDGSWDGSRFSATKKFPTGTTALCTYTLLKCGLSAEHPAVQRGLSFLRHRRPTMHYSAGVTLMLYRSLPEAMRPKDAIRDLTRFLLAGSQEGRWAYPNFGRVDLSNTQYAMLGLKAAAEMGARIPKRLWLEVAKPLLEAQGNYGGWGYHEDAPTASMTTAGMAVLIICRDQLSRIGRVPRGLDARIGVALTSAERWLGKNWSVKRNTSVPPAGGPDTWFYYYLYGLERVGSFTGRDTLAGHAWYEEGARVIVDRQAKDGSWRIGGKDMITEVNTCFSLLFLRRGSRSTSSAAPTTARSSESTDGAFEIGIAYGQPSHLFVRRLLPQAEARIQRGERPVHVSWRIDDEEIGRTEASAEDASNLFPLDHRFTANGTYRLSARMAFATGDDPTPIAFEDSGTIQLRVHDILGPIDEECLADAGNNRLQGTAPEVTVSSNPNAAPLLIDGGYTTAWWSDESDKRPWVELRFPRAISADTLKFGLGFGATPDERARAEQLRLRINGKTITHTCDGTRRKQTVSFSRRSIKRIRLEVLSRQKGKKGQRIGFREIELFRTRR